MTNTEHHDGVALVRLDNRRANAIDPAFLEELDGVLAAAQRDGAKALVLTGYDRYFSGGLALPALVDLPRKEMGRFMVAFSQTMMRIYAFGRPVVAAVNGHAIAGGCVLATMTDARVCADTDLRIGLNETQLGIGLPPCVVEPLRALLPGTSLTEVALAGGLFAPTRARELGLVDEVVATDALVPRALERARALATTGVHAYAQVKLALRGPVLKRVDERTVADTERWLDTWHSEDGRARVLAVAARLKK